MKCGIIRQKTYDKSSGWESDWNKTEMDERGKYFEIKLNIAAGRKFSYTIGGGNNKEYE